jgi:hypothetical protein
MQGKPIKTRRLKRWMGVLLALALAVPACHTTDPDVVERAPDGAAPVDGPSGQTSLSYDAAWIDNAMGRDTRADKATDIDGASGTGEGIPNTTLDAGGNDGNDGNNAIDSNPILDGLDVSVAVDGDDSIDAGNGCSSGYVFCDDFERGEDDTSRWTTTGEAWTLSAINKQGTSNHVYGPVEPVASTAYVTDGHWTDMTVEAKVMVTSFGQPASSNRAEVYARYVDSATFYALGVRGDGKLGLRKGPSGIGEAVTVPIVENEWHTLRIRVSGPVGNTTIDGYWDGALKATTLDTDSIPVNPVGSAGLGVYGVVDAVFDDVRVSSP